MFKRFIAAIVEFFRKEQERTEVQPPIEPCKPRPTEPSPDNKPPTSKTKVAICLGHSYTGSDKGAYGNGTNEVAYNSWVMNYIDQHARSNVKTFRASSSASAAKDANKWGPDVVIQLHLNAYNGTAKGCEVLVINGDTKSYPLAEKFAKEFTTKFNRVMRRSYANGKKVLKSSDRGSYSVRLNGNAIKMLVEPFFIDNKKDFVAKEDYAKFMVDFINRI